MTQPAFADILDANRAYASEFRLAGLRPEDIIVAVDGTPVQHVEDLQRLMTGDLIGRRVGLTVVRGDRTHELTLTPVELDG